MAKKYTGRSAAAARASGRSLAIDKPDIQARKSAAASMKSAGIQNLSGMSGSQGQVERFKLEQNQLRNEYNDKNTSDERKKEIVQDLRGVSRDLNNQNRAAALNQVIREFGPGAVTNTGNIIGSDAGARFQQLRGNPNYFQDGLAGLNTFVGNQRAFKKGDKDLFKQVHPNPLGKLIGAGMNVYKNISPLGLVQNLEKIRKGEKLIPVPDWMKRNMSESPSRMKDFYSAYIDDKNKDIAIAKGEDVDDNSTSDLSNLSLKELNELWDNAQTLDEITEESSTSAAGDPTRIAEDKDLQEDMERSLLNQYSLLQDDSLADTLLDDTEETGLEEAINPVSDAVQNYEEEFMNTYGPDSVPFRTALENQLGYIDRQQAENNPDYLEGGGFDYDINKPGVQNFYDLYLDRGDYPNTPSYLRDTVLSEMPISFQEQSDLPSEFLRDKGVTGGRENFDTAFQDVPFRTDNIPAEAFDSRSYLLPEAMSIIPQQFKDGGNVDTYKMLKLINDTMNDG